MIWQIWRLLGVASAEQWWHASIWIIEKKPPYQSNIIFWPKDNNCQIIKSSTTILELNWCVKCFSDSQIIYIQVLILDQAGSIPGSDDLWRYIFLKLCWSSTFSFRIWSLKLFCFIVVPQSHVSSNLCQFSAEWYRVSSNAVSCPTLKCTLRLLHSSHQKLGILHNSYKKLCTLKFGSIARHFKYYPHCKKATKNLAVGTQLSPQQGVVNACCTLWCCNKAKFLREVHLVLSTLQDSHQKLSCWDTIVTSAGCSKRLLHIMML